MPSDPPAPGAATSTGLLQRPQALDSTIRHIPFAVDVWAPLMVASQLRKGQLSPIRILGKAYVLFRCENGELGCVEDRCPHRNIELSLGRVDGQCLQCAYHGWRVNPKGQSRPGAPAIGSLRVAQRHGVIWAFLGDEDRAASPPDLSPFGARESADITVTLEAQAHWSVVLDNGVDLFHEHLHRDIPLFFKIHRLERIGGNGNGFEVLYRANMMGKYMRRVDGDLLISIEAARFVLNLGGHPIIVGCVTPHDKDGSRITVWWFISHPSGFVYRNLVRFVSPLLKRAIVRGFKQDVSVTESEQRALRADANQQYEVNPAISAVHGYIVSYIERRAYQSLMERPNLHKEDLEALVAEVERGHLIVLREEDGRCRLLDLQSLKNLGVSPLRVHSYWHVRVVVG